MSKISATKGFLEFLRAQASQAFAGGDESDLRNYWLGQQDGYDNAIKLLEMIRILPTENKGQDD